MTPARAVKSLTAEREIALPEDIVHAAKAYMAQARAERTRRAYAQAWALFERWCKEHGRDPRDRGG